MEVKLKRPYAQVLTPLGYSVGGSQMWSDKRIIYDYGCGAVAAFDAFRYLSRDIRQWSKQSYTDHLVLLSKQYFPVLRYFGVNGLTLASGLNRLFNDNAIPYHAKWSSDGEHLLDNIALMLSDDIPAIISIGPNFPILWKKNGVIFYKKNSQGKLYKAATVYDHYVTVIEMDNEWLTVSSWGEEFLIRISEYKHYIEKYSNYLFSNTVLIEKN